MVVFKTIIGFMAITAYLLIAYGLGKLITKETDDVLNILLGSVLILGLIMIILLSHLIGCLIFDKNS